MRNIFNVTVNRNIQIARECYPRRNSNIECSACVCVCVCVRVCACVYNTACSVGSSVSEIALGQATTDPHVFTL